VWFERSETWQRRKHYSDVIDEAKILPSSNVWIDVSSHLYVACNELRSPGERQEFRFPNGLSPFLFAVYVDDIIGELRQSGLGSYIGSTFTGALLYADDTALLACSCLGLQKLTNN